MHRYKTGKLHIGKSKHLVESRDQAIAIALNFSGCSESFNVKAAEKGFLNKLFEKAKGLASTAEGISVDESVKAKVKAKVQGNLKSHQEGLAIASELKSMISDKVKDSKIEPPQKLVELSFEDEKFKGSYRTKSNKAVRFQVNSDRFTVSKS